jgi:hypothetical protein
LEVGCSVFWLYENFLCFKKSLFCCPLNYYYCKYMIFIEFLVFFSFKNAKFHPVSSSKSRQNLIQFPPLKVYEIYSSFHLKKVYKVWSSFHP